MVSIREVEDKYDVDELFTLPDLTTVASVASVGGAIDIPLEAVYFDTADLRLATAGVTLRRRTGGADEGWHLKLAVAPGVRTEIQRPLGRSTRTPPVALRRLVRAFSRDAALEPVARLRTARTVRELGNDAGEVLAEVCDDRVTAEELGNTAALSSWRELEVELVEGDTALLAAVGPALTKAGARPAAHPSKLARVLGSRLRARQQSAPGEPNSAGALIWAAVRGQADLLRAYDPRVRRDEPDAVHKMRVATRTLRSLLAAYRPLFDPALTEPIRDELKWLGGVLGAARDAEVMGQRLQGLVEAQPPELVLGPVAARVRSEQSARYAAAHTALLAELDGDRYLALLDSLDALVAHPPLTDAATERAARVLPARVRRAWRRLSGAVEQAHQPGLSAEERDVALHEARKAAKRARYAAVATGRVGGSDAVAFVKRVKKLQTVLGDHQDSVLGRQQLLETGVRAHLAEENGFTYGLLYGLEETNAAAARDAFERAWRKASRPRRLHWLG